MRKSENTRWHLGQLDALRGIAILNVILVHSVYWSADHVLTLRWPYLNKVFIGGQRGVQLFFLVSAFTLFMSNENIRPEKHATLNFFLRRLFRITPLFYVVTALTLVLWRPIAGPMSHVVLSLLYLSSFSPAALLHGAAGSWSIGTEFAFYACLPLCFRFIKSLRAAVIAFALAYALRLILIAFLVPQDQGSTFWHFMSLPANLPVFMLGVVLFFVWKECIRKLDQGSATARKLSALAVLTSATMYIEQPPASYVILVQGSLIYVMLTLGLLLHPWPIFVNRFTRLVGKVSFSLYMLHFLVAHNIEQYIIPAANHYSVLNHPLPQALIVFWGTTACTLPLALLTWKYIETPGIQLGRSLIARIEGRSRTLQETITPPPLETLLTTTASRDEQF